MQAVADNFPIIFTALLLSLALCWWGLSHYAIASRNQANNGNEKSGSTTSGAAVNPQFASQQAVNKQTRSRSRTINRGGRISAELKSVAALQTQNRQRRRADLTSTTAHSGQSISTARLNIDSTLDIDSTSDSHRTSTANTRDSGSNDSNGVTSGNTATGKSADTTKKPDEKHEKSMHNKGTTVDLQLTGAVTTSALGEPAQSVPMSDTSGAAIPSKAADTTSFARGSGHAAKQAPNKQSREFNGASSVAQSTTQPPGTTTQPPATTQQRPTVKPQAEKIHRASTTDSAKIASTTKDHSAHDEQSKHKPGQTAAAKPVAPRVAAYQMPRGQSGNSTKPLNPLTEVKTTVTNASVAQGKSTSFKQATSESANTGNAHKTNQTTDSNKAEADRAKESVNTSQPATGEPIVKGSNAHETDHNSKTQSAIRKFLGGKKRYGHQESDLPKTDANQSLHAGTNPRSENLQPPGTASARLSTDSNPVSEPATTSAGHAASSTSSRNNQQAPTDQKANKSVDSQSSTDSETLVDKDLSAGAKNPAVNVAVLPSNATTRLRTSQTDQASASLQNSVTPDIRHKTDDEKTVSAQSGNATSELKTASTAGVDNSAASKDAGNAGKYQTAAKLKQLSPSHEAQLQLKTTGVAVAPSSGIDKKTETGKHSAQANLKSKTDQTLSAFAKLPGSTDKTAHAKPQTNEQIEDTATIDAPAAFSGSDDLESALAIEAKDQLIKELKARVADLEAQDNGKPNTAVEHADNSDYKQQLADKTEELQLSNQKIGKLQSTLQTLQSRTSSAPLVPSTSAKGTAHNRASLSSKVRVLDIQSVS